VKANHSAVQDPEDAQVADPEENPEEDQAANPADDDQQPVTGDQRLTTSDW
jgi:hypothetical protein